MKKLLPIILLLCGCVSYAEFEDTLYGEQLCEEVNSLGIDVDVGDEAEYTRRLNVWLQITGWAMGYAVGMDQGFVRLEGNEQQIKREVDELRLLESVIKRCKDVPEATLLRATEWAYFTIEW